jgi:DNA-binding transcriptional LysR family regulator
MNNGRRQGCRMVRGQFNDLLWFLAVAEERSFTRAAARLGIAQSTLSHTIKRLETQMGIRLLTRTTRNVAPTEAGERLRQALAPRVDEIEAEIASLTEFATSLQGRSGSPRPTMRCRATSGRSCGPCSSTIPTSSWR